MKAMYIEPFSLTFDKQIIKTVRVLFPLHREGLTSYFSPILGQYAVKPSEFITTFLVQFNAITSDIFAENFNVNINADQPLYSEDLVIPLIVNIFKGGKFKLSIFTPTIGFLFSAYLKKRRRIYKRYKGGKLTLLRNYKKLFQLILFKNDYLYGNKTQYFAILSHYKLIRNALYQKI